MTATHDTSPPGAGGCTVGGAGRDALERCDPSPRGKEVAHPRPTLWVHHLEVRDVAQVDDEVVGWLCEAAAQAQG